MCVVLNFTRCVTAQRSSQPIKNINLYFSFSGSIMSFHPEVVNYKHLKFIYCSSIYYTAIVYNLLAVMRNLRL